MPAHPGSHLVIAAGLVLVGCVEKESGQNVRADLPNIVVITLDTTRADHLGTYGYHRDTSPTIDALASESIVFDRCIVPMATTLPTHTSIFTATYPMEHGVLENLRQGSARLVPSERLQTFASVGLRSGYQTAAFVSAAPLKRGSGIETGFEHFDQPVAGQRRAAETNKQVFDWLSNLDDRPLLLWVHYFDAHWPYDAPPAFRAMYADDEGLERYLAEREVPATALRPLVPDEIENARSATNGYDAEIRYMDLHLGHLLERLEGLSGETAVLLVGDHGEGLCQHGQAAHRGTWDEQLWVPMMIRAPGQPSRREAHVVSAVDAIPTLLGLIDVPELEGILPQVSGRDALAAGFEPKPVLSQDTGQFLGQSGYRYVLTTDRWKYALTRRGSNEFEQELYDLGADPFELENLWTEGHARAELLRSILVEQLAAQENRAHQLRGDSTVESSPMDPALIEQLQSLGYVQ